MPRAEIDGVKIEGTADEIASIIRKLKDKPKTRTRIPDHNCDDTYLGCDICAGIRKPLYDSSDYDL